MEEVNNIFKHARDNTPDLSNKKSRYRNITDEYGNTLLHITTEHSNLKYIEELLNENYDPYVKNKFKKSAWDIAVLNQEKKILDKFVDHRVKNETQVLKNENNILNDNILNLTKKRKYLEECLVNLESENKRLMTAVAQHDVKEFERIKEIKLLKKSKSSLSNEVYDLKLLFEDIQNDNVVLKNTNKKLRKDNEDFKNANENLKKSIDTLLSSNMK